MPKFSFPAIVLTTCISVAFPAFAQVQDALNVPLVEVSIDSADPANNGKNVRRSEVKQTPEAYKKLNEDIIYQVNIGTAAKVAELLFLGANPNGKNSEDWPLISMAASRSDGESNEIVRHLVEYGAEVNVRDPKGETPIMNAIVTANLSLVRYLIENGGDYRATAGNGRSVLAFADYYGNQPVIDLVNETIRIDEERIREGKSRRRFYRILDDYIFFNCAQQYIAYNQETHFYREGEKAKAAELFEQSIAKVKNARMELEYNFRLPEKHAATIAENTQLMIFNDLEGLITNRNRRTLGVGTSLDIDKRCKDILNVWRSNFPGYEAEAARAEAAVPALTPAAPVEESMETTPPPLDVLPKHLKVAP